MSKSIPLGRSYGQICALAKALDVVGQRWTLLIVRNLLVGPLRYSELLEGLPGITTNLLAKRLSELTRAGLLRTTAQRRVTLYELTPLGRGLEPALFALADWGDRIVLPKAPDDVYDLRWGVLSLRRRYAGGFRGTVELVRSGEGEKRFQLRADGCEAEVTDVPRWEPEVRVESSDEQLLLRVLMVGLPWRPAAVAGQIVVRGDPERLDAFLASVASLQREPAPDAQLAPG